MADGRLPDTDILPLMVRLRRAVGLAGVGWLVWRLFGPEIPPMTSYPQTRPVRIPGRTVFVGSREFFVREAGPPGGPPLVLLHGWSFDAEMTFFNVVPGLAERFRVIMPDNRGHGRSDWIRGRYSIADVADDTAGVLGALRIDHAIVVGYSMGGMVAQELAHRHPALVERLVLAATAARPVRSGLGFSAVLWLGRAIARVGLKDFSTISTKVLLRAGAIESEHARWMWESLMRRDANMYFEAGSAVRRFESRPWVGSLRMPVMVIVNTKDQIVPVATQYELASFFGDDDLVQIQDGRHESIMNRAEEYVTLIGVDRRPLQ